MRTRTILIMPALVLLTASFPAIAGPVPAKPTTAPPQAGLPPLDGQHLFNDTFARVDTVNALPPSVLNELIVPEEKLKQWAGGKLSPAKIADIVSRDKMADPGQPFQLTDVVGPKSLPFRRLVFAGVSSGYCFVYNEFGGFASGTEVSLYRLPPPPLPERAVPGPPLPADQTTPRRATLVWQASLRDYKTFLTWEQLRHAIIQGRYYTLYIPPLPPSPVLSK